jgi:hypothetical protein
MEKSRHRATRTSLVAVSISAMFALLCWLSFTSNASASSWPASGCRTASVKFSTNVGDVDLLQPFCWHNGESLTVGSFQIYCHVGGVAEAVGGACGGVIGQKGPECQAAPVTDEATNTSFSSVPCAFYKQYRRFETKACVGVGHFQVCHHWTDWYGLAVTTTGHAWDYFGSTSSNGHWYELN